MGTLIIQLLLAFIALATMIWAWWVNNNADKKKVVADESKEITDAVKSGDGARVDDVVDKLRE